MSDPTDQQKERPASARGEAAWKEARDRVARRNADARTAGKRRRQDYERRREGIRREVERRAEPGGRPQAR
jgi:hypothetical protein